MKTMNWNDREIELTSVFYRYGIGTEPQEGIYVHDTTDEFGDGDAIYGNGWKLENIHDASDVESLIASGDFSTYITKNNDGTYTMDAENEKTLWEGYDPEGNHIYFVMDHLGRVWVCRQDGRELWNDEYYTEDGLDSLELAILNEGYRLS